MMLEGLLAVPRLSEIEVRLGKQNNLNLIRQVLASLVVIHHSYLLCGAIENDPMRRYLGFSNLGTTAVWSFFFISGYLIAKSADRSSPSRFATARALRIFPGLFVVVMACVFVLGPCETTLSVKEYFAHPETYRYLRWAVLQKVPNCLPGVFQEGWFEASVNSSLWTLPGEWVLYSLILAGFTLLKCLRGHLAWATGCFTILATACFTATLLPLPWHFARIWLWYGALGVLTFIFRNRLPLSVPVAVIAMATTLTLIKLGSPLGYRTFSFCLAYFLLVIACHPSLQLPWSPHIGDYSYGTYLYGWPIQQVVVPFASTPWSLFLVSYPITLCAAVLSWHFVEKPALSVLVRKVRSTDER